MNGILLGESAARLAGTFPKSMELLPWLAIFDDWKVGIFKQTYYKVDPKTDLVVR